MDYIFEKGLFVEDDLEKAIIELFKEQDYEYVHGDMIHRRFEDVIIDDDLRRFIKSRYSNANLSDTEVESIVIKMKNVGNYTTLYQNNKEAYYLFSRGFDFNREDSKKLGIHIDYIDFGNPENNIFKIVNQYTIEGSQKRRPDLLLFINGIPICIFEFKTAIKEETTIFDAWKQITTRYTRDIEKLMQYCFLSVISDGAHNRLGTIFTPYEYYYAWNKVNEQEKVVNGISSLFSLIKGAFAKDRILAILQDFIYYPEQAKQKEKEIEIVCRYPQFFAANKMTQSIKEHLTPKGDGKAGIYFGATGCGKTYTMLFMAKLIKSKYAEIFNNPTIVIITDREDLNSQTADVFSGAVKYLGENDIRTFESRKDLHDTLVINESGGVYITTIQKFCEETGLLSDRNNIICISDEAHRSQTNVGTQLKQTEKGVVERKGFAQYLRESLPNATYCGFTGTPIDETLAVFGKVVDQYTMKEASDDGITVRIAYEPRLARVILSEEKTKEIEEYYKKCAEEGSTQRQIDDSKRAMASISSIIGNPSVIKKMAKDIVLHYEALCNEKPNIVQKGMIVCPDRKIAYDLYKEITSNRLRPEWKEAKKCADGLNLSAIELEKLDEIPFINLVATRNEDDDKDLYNMCGTKEYRQKLDKLFKNDNSNFKLAIVVDMWITGFDVPSLAVMYINKPLKRHTLIQTISRVNRVFEGKEKGLIVDYIGFKQNMLEAVKLYGNEQESPIDEINTSLDIFRNQLSKIDDLLASFDASKFFLGKPLERLICLNNASEYIQRSSDLEKRFMKISKQLKAAYNIVFPTGLLTDTETVKAQFYLAIRSIIYKQTLGDAPDTETMNKKVEAMIKEAIACTGVENIVDVHKKIDIFSDEFRKEIDKIDMPITKFNALLKLVKQAINQYAKVNKVKAVEFTELLEAVVKKYNTRDKLIFTSEVLEDFVNGLSDEILDIMKKLEEDEDSFKKMGISFEEKAFFDILIKVRDTHNFEYSDDKCIILAKEIKKLVDDKSKFADWSTRDDIKNQLNMDLTILLYNNGYPPEWDDEVFEKVLEQAENFKKYE